MPSGIVFNDGYRSSMHNAWPGLTLEAFARAQRDQRKHAEELSYKDGKDNQEKMLKPEDTKGVVIFRS